MDVVTLPGGTYRYLHYLPRKPFLFNERWKPFIYQIMLVEPYLGANKWCVFSILTSLWKFLKCFLSCKWQLEHILMTWTSGNFPPVGRVYKFSLHEEKAIFLKIKNIKHFLRRYKGTFPSREGKSWNVFWSNGLQYHSQRE